MPTDRKQQLGTWGLGYWSREAAIRNPFEGVLASGKPSRGYKFSEIIFIPVLLM